MPSGMGGRQQKQEDSWPSLDSARKIKWTTPISGLRNRATIFAQNWQNRGNEKSEARSYWMELLQDVLQLSDTNNPKTVCFERKHLPCLRAWACLVRIAARASGENERSIIMIAVICLFAGSAAGFFTASLCMAARRGDRMRPDGR